MEILTDDNGQRNTATNGHSTLTSKTNKNAIKKTIKTDFLVNNLLPYLEFKLGC